MYLGAKYINTQNHFKNNFNYFLSTIKFTCVTTSIVVLQTYTLI